MIHQTIAFATLGLLAATASAASFDCAKAQTPVERAICADPALSALDEQLAQVYQREQANDRTRRASQRDWLVGTRNRCTTPQCLEQAYSTRLAALKSPQPACAITATALVGNWLNVDQNGEGFEEADFLGPDRQQAFVSFVRHAPYVTGTWTLQDCRIHIEGSGDRTDVDLSVTGFEHGRLTLKDESEGSVSVFKRASSAK